MSLFSQTIQLGTWSELAVPPQPMLCLLQYLWMFQNEEKTVPPPDLIPTHPLKDVADDMGQKSSQFSNTKPKLSLTWILRNQHTHTTHNPNPEQPIKFQYKTRRKSVESTREKPTANDSYNNKVRLNNEVIINCSSNLPVRTKSEPSLNTERVKEKHRHKKRSSRSVKQEKNRFGYEINDVDAFLTKVSIYRYILIIKTLVVDLKY